MAKKSSTTKPSADAATKTKKSIAKPAPKVAKSAPKAKPEKKAVAPKVATKSTGDSDSKKALDLCLLMDCTGSMSSWIDRSKTQLKAIIDSQKIAHPELKVRVSFVGYRDFGDKPGFEIIDFTEDLEAVKAFIGKISASGGGDTPEDVQGGYHTPSI